MRTALKNPKEGKRLQKILYCAVVDHTWCLDFQGPVLTVELSDLGIEAFCWEHSRKVVEPTDLHRNQDCYAHRIVFSSGKDEKPVLPSRKLIFESD